jgi:HK97 family phage major capsid protein
MSMSLAEAQKEIDSRLEAADLIEKKYPDPADMPNVDVEEVKRLLLEVDDLESKRAGLEDAEARRNRIAASMNRHSRPQVTSFKPSGGSARDDDEETRLAIARKTSPGMQFLQNREYRQLKNDGIFNSALARTEFSVNLAEGTSLIDWAMARKALLRGGSTTSGQAFVLEDHRAGFVEILQREINVLDLLTRVPTESDTIEYVKEDTFTNSAAFVAEATGFNATALGDQGVKPESTLTYSTATSTVRTLAHWIPVTNRMLSDAPAIRGLIDTRLLLGLTLALESQVISGNGSGENLTGILTVNGTNVVAGGSYNNAMDAIYKGRTLVRVTGHGRPSAAVLHPNDWEQIRLARENAATATLGQYLMGPPSQQGPVTLWGMPIVESEAMTEGTAVVGDWAMGATLFDREQGSIRVGTINDQFIRNIQTILAELRVAFVAWRPAVFSKVTAI